jgi:hypothetical protein
MAPTASTSRPEPKSLGICLLVIAGSLVVTFLVCTGLIGVLRLPLHLLIGWAYFVERVAPQVSMAWDGAGMALACAVLLLLMFQAVGTNLMRRATPAGVSPWTWRRSLALTVATAVVFWAGLSAVGLMRSVQWFLTMEQPVFENRSLR